ncbi:MAG TPA: hypothetical protein PK993_03970 [Clostridia bacterium]|nr:hypothetical protein [Clostridia bacterium]
MGRIFDIILWGLLTIILLQIYIINKSINLNWALVTFILFFINALIIEFFTIKKAIMDYLIKKQEKELKEM